MDTIQAAHWDSAEKLPSPAVQKQVHNLRLLCIKLFFDRHMHCNDGGEDKQFMHVCGICQQCTTYYRSPKEGYPVPLCLSGECLTNKVLSQGEHWEGLEEVNDEDLEQSASFDPVVTPGDPELELSLEVRNEELED